MSFSFRKGMQFNFVILVLEKLIYNLIFSVQEMGKIKRDIPVMLNFQTNHAQHAEINAQ